MWARGFSQSQIAIESGLCRQQVGSLCNEWRKANEGEPPLGEWTASMIVECDETAISGI